MNNLFKILIGMGLVLIISACNSKSDFSDESYCSVTQTTEGAVITCSNGTTATVTNGSDGTNGLAGSNCSVYPITTNVNAPNGGSLIICQDGSQATVLNGTNGSDGTDGASCSITVVATSDAAPNGGSLITCEDGTNSLVLNGINGTNGASGTIIQPIQFCPKTSSYPTTFSEMGFCINGSIYAVYSANNGFLTEILPGTWSSNGINSSCTFTVKPNCVIEN